MAAGHATPKHSTDCQADINPATAFFGTLIRVKMHAPTSFHTTLRAIAATSDTLRLGFVRGFECGELFDRIYAQRAGGRFGIGRLIDAYVLGLPACDALRQRRNLVRMALRAAIAREPGAHVLDLGSGAGRYVVESLRANDAAKSTRATCIDLDGSSLRVGRALAKKHNVAGITYEQRDALNIAQIALAHMGQIVLVSGLFDYVSDAQLRDTLARIHNHLDPRTLIFTARSTPARPSHTLEALFTPSESRVRPIATLEAWARAAGYTYLQSSQTTDGAHTVITARKIAA